MKAKFIHIGEDTLFLSVGKHWINVSSIDFIQRTPHGIKINTTGNELDLDEEETSALEELLSHHEEKESWQS